MPPSIEVFGEALVTECRRRLFGEYLPRLRKCLGHLTDDEIWRRPNGNTPSVGNLVLHLCGNARQWIVAGLGGEKDSRERAKEFSERGPIPALELLRRLEETMAEVEIALGGVDPKRLLEVRRVQGFEESGLSILVHVVEHFSYHVGQVTYVVKSLKDIDLAYYAGVDLNRLESGPPAFPERVFKSHRPEFLPGGRPSKGVEAEEFVLRREENRSAVPGAPAGLLLLHDLQEVARDFRRGDQSQDPDRIALELAVLKLLPQDRKSRRTSQVRELAGGREPDPPIGEIQELLDLGRAFIGVS